MPTPALSDMGGLAREIAKRLGPHLAGLLSSAATATTEPELERMLWHELEPRINAREAACEAAHDLASTPEDPDAQTVFRKQIEKILNADPALAARVRKLIAAKTTAAIVSTEGSLVVRVFVSSTWEDLQPERRAAEAVVHGMRETKYVGMEYFGSRPETTREASLEEVDSSRVYVGIIGGRYGSGITEAEYRRARERDLPCFIYFKDDQGTGPNARETDPEQREKLDAFKQDLRAHSDGQTCHPFQTPHQLGTQLALDLHRWLVKEFLTPQLESALQGQITRQQTEVLLASIKDLSQINQELLRQLRARGFSISQGERSVAGRQFVDSTIVTGDGNVAAGTGGVAIHDHRGPIIIHPPIDEGTTSAQRARLKYLKNLRQQCEIIPLATLGEDEGVEAGLTLDAVYIALDTKTPVALSDTEKADPRNSGAFNPHEESRPLTAMEAVQMCSRLVLLGDPGAGKSTFVNQLLACQSTHQLETTDARSTAIPPDLFPIRVILRDLVPRLAALQLDELPVPDARAAAFAVFRDQVEADLARLEAQDYAEGLREVLQSGNGRILVVLDGLDEVPFELHRHAWQCIKALLTITKAAQVIVTCRIRSYEGDARLPGFEPHTLAPFNEDKIRDFVAAWYRAQRALGRIDVVHEKAKVDDLTGAALGPDLRELSSNPMLLTTMALIHQREIQLPGQRVQLYSLAVDVLVRRWQKGKTGKLAAFLQDNLALRAALERLAYEAHMGGRDKRDATDLPRGTAITLLELKEYLGGAGLAAEFLDYVDQRAGLLVGRGAGPGQPLVYSFPHRTFQEYLAGCYLLRERDSARQARAFFRHAAEGDCWRVAARLAMEELRYNDPRGIHSLLDIAYRLCGAEEPADAQSRRANLWAANMALLAGRDTIDRDTESPDGGPQFLKRVIARLLGLLNCNLAPPERAEAGRILAALGDPRRAVVPANVNDVEAMEFCYVPGGPFRAGEGNADSNVESLADGYWISRYPVTIAQFRLFVEAGGYAESRFWPEAREAGFWSKDGFKGRQDGESRREPTAYGAPWSFSNHPVVGVTWYEALAYCRWLTEIGDRYVEKGFRFQLPSERQWEKAARGGEQIPRSALVRQLAERLAPLQHLELERNPLPSRAYPWGDEFASDRANCMESGIGTTSALGCALKGASPYGVLELSGNVWEWTRSLHGEGEELAAPPDEARVLRGGSFYSYADYARCANRSRLSPGSRNDSFGFRVVASPF